MQVEKIMALMQQNLLTQKEEMITMQKEVTLQLTNMRKEMTLQQEEMTQK